MPSVKGIQGPYRFLFYSFDCAEPKHVHVLRDDMTCKFWLEPVALASNHGYSGHELTRIRELISHNPRLLLEAWDDHCGEH